MIYKDQQKDERSRELALALPEVLSLSTDVSVESKVNNSTGKEDTRELPCVAISKFFGLVVGVYFVAFLVCYLKISYSNITQSPMLVELENIMDGLVQLKSADSKLRNQLFNLDILNNEPDNAMILTDFYQKYSNELYTEMEKKLNQHRQLVKCLSLLTPENISSHEGCMAGYDHTEIIV